MQDFSRLKIEADHLQSELDRFIEIQSASDFSEKLKTAKFKKSRISKTKDSFAFFNHTYFPPEVHRAGYFQPGRLQKAIPEIASEPGFHIVLGPRGYGKTVDSIISVIWRILKGEIAFIGTYSETLDKARALKNSIASILESNPRINYDYKIEVERNNDNEFRFRIGGQKQACTIKPYSIDRSVRGAMQVFDRVEFLLGDDIETESSSTVDDIVENRIRRLEEAYKSLTDNGTFLILGNNFDEDCALNKLLLRQDEDKLETGHTIHVFPAWDENLGCLWPARYMASSEEVLQIIHEAGEEEWSGNFQQRPEKKGGYIFPAEYWEEYDELPEDARGVGYCDPNLAMKTDISDTTALGGLLYSPTQNLFFGINLRCLAFGSADELVCAYFDSYSPAYIGTMGFDGNVNQEAVWSNFVLNWCIRHHRPFPPIDYRKYDVDLHAKSVQAVWAESRILFPRGFKETEEGARFYKQIIKFKGKKKKRRGQKVDAADWLICAFQLLHDPEVGLGEFYRREFEMKIFPEPLAF